MEHPLTVVRVNAKGIVFRYCRGGTLVPFLLGLLLLYIVAFVQFRGAILLRIAFFCLAVLLLGFVVRAALWTDQLTIDLVHGLYDRSTGPFWRIAHLNGAVKEIDAITLNVELRAAGRGNRYPVWIVALRFDDAHLIKLEAERDEAKAHNLVLQLTRVLNLPLIDQTTEPPVKYAWQDVGVPLVVRAMSSPAVTFATGGTPPPGSGIHVTREDQSAVIVLPRAGVRVDALFLIGFTSLFSVLGCRTLLVMVEASRTGAENWIGGWVVGAFQAMIGLSGLFHGLNLMWGQEWLRDEGNAFSLGASLLGVSRGKVRIEKAEVLDISVRSAWSLDRNRRAPNEGMAKRLSLVGSAQSTVSILSRKGRWQFGAVLATTEQQWLAETLRGLCVSRS